MTFKQLPMQTFLCLEEERKHTQRKQSVISQRYWPRGFSLYNETLINWDIPLNVVVLLQLVLLQLSRIAVSIEWIQRQKVTMIKLGLNNIFIVICKFIAFEVHVTENGDNGWPQDKLHYNIGQRLWDTTSTCKQKLTQIHSPPPWGFRHSSESLRSLN